MYQFSELRNVFLTIPTDKRNQRFTFYHERFGNMEGTKKSAECLINQAKLFTFPLKSLCEFSVSFFNKWEVVQVNHEQRFKLPDSFSLDVLSINDALAILNNCLQQNPNLSIPSTDLRLRKVTDR